MSEMSWLILVISSWLRLESIEKFLKIGCVYCASQLELYCGFTVADSDVVVCRLLFMLTRKLPPCHGTCWVRLPLKVFVLALMVVDPGGRPAVVLVGCVTLVWVDTVVDSVGTYTARKLARLMS